MNFDKPLSQILKAVLLSSSKPISIKQMIKLFPEEAEPSKDIIETALDEVSRNLEGDVAELRKLASGYVIQIRQEFSEWVGKMIEEKPPRYSRAVLETMAIIAYRQPITRSEIEDIRGVAVNTVMVKTLMEREWIRVIGHKDVPGKPAIYGTTQHFLDYFNLSSLTDLPPIGDIKELTDEEIQKIESILDENPDASVDAETPAQGALALPDPEESGSAIEFETTDETEALAAQEESVECVDE